MRILKDTIFILGIWFINIVSPKVAGKIMETWVRAIKNKWK